MIKNILLTIKGRWKAHRAPQKVRTNYRLIHGLSRVKLQENQAAVVSLMKNSAFFIRDFIEHHQALGASHILIVDNGSTDDTVKIARSYPAVTILENTLPVHEFECVMRSEAAKMTFDGGWIIFVDSDELFEPPISNLTVLLSYLSQFGYTAMVNQMLDLYDPAPYGECKNASYSEIVKRCTHYSLNEIKSIPYLSRSNPHHWFVSKNKCSNSAIMLKVGGIRHEIFKEPYTTLSKHSIVKNTLEVESMVHPHYASKVNIADVTGLIRHYKLGGNYLERDKKSVETKAWKHNEDLRRLNIAEKKGDNFIIEPKLPHVFEGTQKLIEQGFLSVSDQYLKFITNSDKTHKDQQ